MCTLQDGLGSFRDGKRISFQLQAPYSTADTFTSHLCIFTLLSNFRGKYINRERVLGVRSRELSLDPQFYGL